MRFGVCAWTFGDQPLALTAQTLGKLGFDGVELLGDLDAYGNVTETRQILSDAGLAVCSITPTDADLSHPDPAIRQNAVDYYARAVEFAAALDCPIVSCHGLVGRIKALSTQSEEDAHLRDAIHQICERAQAANINIVFEVLNRYESHQICTHEQALALIVALPVDNLGVLLDAYHMNIEEANPAQALTKTGDKLWLYHVADSNRQGIGHGHTDFATQFEALKGINYTGDVILELNAVGPNPFTPDKGGAWRDELAAYLRESLVYLKENLAN